VENSELFTEAKEEFEANVERLLAEREKEQF
jgi:hypothetical protein